MVYEKLAHGREGDIDKESLVFDCLESHSREERIDRRERESDTVGAGDWREEAQ